jgi:hypothetical protein
MSLRYFRVPQPGGRPAAVVIEPHTIWLTAAVVASLVLAWIVLSRIIGTLLLLFIAIIFAEGLRPWWSGYIEATYRAPWPYSSCTSSLAPSSDSSHGG